jgi:nitric oxide reductase subunit B
MDFMQVQNEISIHFVVLVLCATMFTVGIVLYIVDFYKHGKPNDEALELAID